VDDQARDATKDAIAFLHAALADIGPAGSIERALVDAAAGALPGLTLGLTNLAVVLLNAYADSQGITARDALEAIAAVADDL
jgi:hypothetical protein